ncbi:MAG: hypothetical protein ACE5H1_08880 [Thermodesulfobacteriota bacterium]
MPESVLKLDECCYRPIGLSGRDLENIANNLKVVLGDRYVHFDSFPTLRAPGILLYLGDIRPSHTYRDMPGYFPTVRSRITYKWATIAKIDEINTMVTADLTRPVPKALLKFYPNANVREFLSKVGKYYVITI